MAYRHVQHLIVPSGHVLGIIKDLPDNFSPGLWVSPEFAFNQFKGHPSELQVNIQESRTHRCSRRTPALHR